MLTRTFDLLLSIIGLLICTPVLLPVVVLVWLGDKKSPFYIAPRVGRYGLPFQMVKIRSMQADADRNGFSSTSNDDSRITPIGHFVRRFKIDELAQLWNVLIGEMSVVGPRPQVQSGVDLYSSRERALLSVKPGMTDFASIVFSDEGEILAGHADPDAAYNTLIRPGKSLLGLFYVEKNSFMSDAFLVILTIVAIFSKKHALKGVRVLLKKMEAPEEILLLASRE